MAEIDTLEVKIKADAQSATRSLYSLATALGKVQSALVKTNKNSVVQQISQSINDLNTAVTGLNVGGIAKLDVLSASLKTYAEALERFKGLKNVPTISKKLQEVSGALDIPNKEGTVEQPGGSSAVDQANDSIKELAKETDKARVSIKKMRGETDKLWSSLKRIAFYRLIRTAIKEIGEAFETGLKNAYHFSKETAGFTRLADALDHIKSTSAQMVNQLGAWWGEMIQLILPALNWIIDKARSLFELMTEVTAALNGEFFYEKAKLESMEWDKATEAVKKYKGQLLGLDELNNLSSGNDDSANLTDYSLKYEKAAVRPEVFNVTSRIRSFLKDAMDWLKETWEIDVSDILFNWDDLDGEDVAKKIIAGIGGLLGTVTGFKFDGVPGAVVGAIAGVTIASTIASLLFKKGVKYDKAGLREILYPVLGAITGAWILFKKSGLTGALIGMSIGATIGMVLSQLNFSKDKGLTYNKTQLANQLIGSALVGIAGALIGFEIGGVKGALIGMSVGATIGMAIGQIFFGKDMKPYTKEQLANQLIASALVGIMSGLVGWGVGGIAGALLSLTIGVILTFFVVDTEWKTDDGKPDPFGIPSELTPNGEAGRLKPGTSIYDVLPIRESASGGLMPNGTLFYAGEAGTEFIGNIGTSSAVANTQQMTDAIYKAAYMGMSQALKENGGMGGFEPATTDDLFIAMRKKASKFNKKTGNSAFA